MIKLNTNSFQNSIEQSQIRDSSVIHFDQISKETVLIYEYSIIVTELRDVK
jgi:hypothetical protein